MTNAKRAARLFKVSQILFVFAAIGFIANQPAHAEQSSDAVVDYVKSSAKLIYNLAWPTATFENWRIANLRRNDQVYEVVVKLTGLSGIAGSSLWLKLGFEFNSAGLNDVKVLDQNAFWVAPFATIRGVARLGSELAKQYSKPGPSPLIARPSPTQAAALCIANETESTLKFRYHWESQPWTAGMVGPKQIQQYWWTLGTGDDSSPGFYIEYDNSFDEGYTPQMYLLNRHSTQLPIDCGSAKQYQFSTDGRNVFLQSAN